MVDNFSKEKSTASAWFSDLRDKIIQRFEALESHHKSDMPAGLFELRETKRTASDGSDAGGGLMSVMRGGRVYCLWHIK
jgi:coproporphyrinogen III oxidase